MHRAVFFVKLKNLGGIEVKENSWQMKKIPDILSYSGEFHINTSM